MPRKGKKKKRHQQYDDADTTIACQVCGAAFDSKTKLFKHLTKTGHAVAPGQVGKQRPPPCPPAGATSAAHASMTLEALSEKAAGASRGGPKLTAKEKRRLRALKAEAAAADATPSSNKASHTTAAEVPAAAKPTKKLTKKQQRRLLLRQKEAAAAAAAAAEEEAESAAGAGGNDGNDDDKNAPAAEETALRTWLGEHRLEQYGDALVADGWDELALVATMTQEELLAVEGMKKGHSKKLAKAAAALLINLEEGASLDAIAQRAAAAATEARAAVEGRSGAEVEEEDGDAGETADDDEEASSSEVQEDDDDEVDTRGGNSFGGFGGFSAFPDSSSEEEESS